MIKDLNLTEATLLQRCFSLEGLNFHQLSLLVQYPIPHDPLRRKGWAGLALEKALGATAGSKPIPDFYPLCIELKTMPINAKLEPAESTFICQIPLLSIHRQVWLSSDCYAKLQRILWVPIEACPLIPFSQRRIGHAFLWSPNLEEASVLANDWQELSSMIAMGKLAEIDARIGKYLQVRPKAKNAHSLCYGFDEEGAKVKTLPRGFYLRKSFTKSLFQSMR